MRYEIAIKFDNVDELIGAVKILRDAGAVATVVERVETKTAETTLSDQYAKQDKAVAQGGDPGPSDPWAVNSATEAANAPVSQSTQATTVVDKFDNQWILNSPGAPTCSCGISAGKIKGTSRAGKPYSAWRCAKAVGAGDAWKSKCDFSAQVR